MLIKLWRAFALIVGTGCGAGYSPIAPATVGSLWCPVLMWGWQSLKLPFPAVFPMWIALFLIGIPICSEIARRMKKTDPGHAVFDEIAAAPAIFLLVPTNWQTAIVGFFVFRFFDIWKPWPARQLEKLHGGLGIMIDDQFAGIYSGIVVYGIHKLLFA
ncbi:MAG: phosphatidylglycerophosphatase A [Planctomycetaceae bacterium]|nr:phosphatidylglycerophosphatase A [Planctomycetaceae bacterium]